MRAQNGQILIIALIFMVIILVLSGILVSLTVLHTAGERQGKAREQAMNLAEAGVERALYQLNYGAGSGYVGETDFSFGGGVTDIAVVAISASLKRVTATAYVPDKGVPRAKRSVQADLDTGGPIIVFSFAVQVGEGGLEMAKDAQVVGNIYSNGPIKGTEDGARATGDAISAGTVGRIEKLQVDGTATAHTIKNSEIGGSAYGYVLDDTTVGGSVLAYSLKNCTIGGNADYTTKTNCTIGGAQTTPYAGYPDQPAQDFPITDQQITDWKNAAEAGGVISGNYTLNNGQSASLGPKKITGDLKMKENSTLTLTGPIWVEGKIDIDKDGTIALDTAYGSSSEVLITDEQADLSKEVNFQRAGADSYVLLISLSVAGDAIKIAKNSDALVAYAPNGTVTIQKSVTLREVTANKLKLEKDAQVIYESGLASVEFTSGPSGGWRLKRGTRVEKK